jgi:hypothetical protein
MLIVIQKEKERKRRDNIRTQTAGSGFDAKEKRNKIYNGGRTAALGVEVKKKELRKTKCIMRNKMYNGLRTAALGVEVKARERKTDMTVPGVAGGGAGELRSRREVPDHRGKTKCILIKQNV